MCQAVASTGWGTGMEENMRVLRLSIGLVASLLAIGPALAEPNARNAVAALPTQHAEMTYAGYVAGFNVMNARTGLELTTTGYQVGIAFRTAGMISVFFRGDNLSRVDGVWHGLSAAPRHYESGGTWRGDRRHTEIDYPDGQPHLMAMLPQVEPDRDPVPAAMQRNTIDVLSAVAMLVHSVAMTGRCEGSATTFDGHRVSEVKATTVGMETLPPESRSSFSGPALRCDLDGRQLAGFPKDAGPDDMIHKPQHSTVWLASLQPGMPQVPVLLSIETRNVGHVTLYVTQGRSATNIAEFKPQPLPTP